MQEKYNTPFVPPQFEKPKFTPLKEVSDNLSAAAVAFLQERGISLATAEAFGLKSCRAWFREMGREAEAIALPYYVQGKPFGNKIRCIEQKEHCCDKPLNSLFGIQLVDMVDGDDFIICEGEFDPMALYEAKVPNATSVPNGSSSFKKMNEDGTMKEILGFLWEGKEYIDKAKRILIATDGDEPGDKIAEELARRIGRHRCWRVLFPEGCKDANDVLKAHGAQAVAECIKAAKPWPIEGLYEAEKYYDDVLDLFENGFSDRVSTGLAEVDHIYAANPGLLTVVTGIPGNGKSTFVDQLMVNLARSRGYISAIQSFENEPPVHIGKLAQVLLQKHFFEKDMESAMGAGKRMTRQELLAVKPFINRHFKFLQQDDGKKATLASILERIKTAVFRWGINCAVIDPYNYIARPKDIESETQWIDDMLTEIRLLAVAYGLHIWFIAHPTKMPQDSEGNYQVPKGYAISGSAAWFSKPDFGLTVHRVPNSGQVKIVNWKTRYDWLGKIGEAIVLYDNVHHIYMAEHASDDMPFDPRGWKEPA